MGDGWSRERDRDERVEGVIAEPRAGMRERDRDEGVEGVIAEPRAGMRATEDGTRRGGRAAEATELGESNAERRPRCVITGVG